MRELKLILSDDLIYAASGERVPADETVTIALDGKVREVDLTSAHAKELRELLAPYLKVGHVRTADNEKKPVKTTQPSSELILSRARQKKIRDWADSLGLRSDDGKRPIYRTAGGGYYYPFKLLQMWDEHLAEQEKS